MLNKTPAKPLIASEECNAVFQSLLYRFPCFIENSLVTNGDTGDSAGNERSSQRLFVKRILSAAVKFSV